MTHKEIKRYAEELAEGKISCEDLENEEWCSASDLTFIAEHLNEQPTSPNVVRALNYFLNHDRAIVREGGIYGSYKHKLREIGIKIKDLKLNDVSEGVRRSAEEFFEDLTKE